MPAVASLGALAGGARIGGLTPTVLGRVARHCAAGAAGRGPLSMRVGVICVRKPCGGSGVVGSSCPTPVGFAAAPRGMAPLAKLLGAAAPSARPWRPPSPPLQPRGSFARPPTRALRGVVGLSAGGRCLTSPGIVPRGFSRESPTPMRTRVTALPPHVDAPVAVPPAVDSVTAGMGRGRGGRLGGASREGRFDTMAYRC